MDQQVRSTCRAADLVRKKQSICQLQANDAQDFDTVMK